MNWVISAFSLILSSWFHTPACVNFSFEFCVTVPNWWGPQTYYTCCILWQEIFCPTAEHWLVYQLYYVKGKEKKKREKFIALVLFSISTVALLKTLCLSDESECYLPLEEALCLSRKKLNFQGCHLEGLSLRKLARILSLLSSEGSSIPGSVTLTVSCTVNVYLGENRIS